MRRFLRTLLNIVGMAIPALQSGGAVAAEPPSSQAQRAMAPGVTTLVKGLAADPALRARFAANAQAVLREGGVDGTSYDAPTQLAEADVARVLAAWLGPSGPSVGSSVTDDEMLVSDDGRRVAPTAVIYGPPPSPSRRTQMPARPPVPHPSPAPPSPVYGPPPGLRER